MIEVKVDEYCQECPYFEAESQTSDNLDSGVYLYPGVRPVITTTIQCEHRFKCRAIKNYLERRMEEKK